MSHGTQAQRIEERRLAKIIHVPGGDTRTGARPPRGEFWTSATILRLAGYPGMLNERRARQVCGFRHATPSKYRADGN